jgi:hypothetical protein
MRSLQVSFHKPVVIRLLGGLCAALLLAVPPLQAQQLDPPDTNYTTGNQEDDPAVLQTFPLDQPYRAYLPVSVDLSYRLPDPGDQGKAESCTAWAVGYAARSYYTSAYEARDVHEAQNVPSPAFLYNLSWRRNPKSTCQSGSNFATAAAILQQGAPSLADYPYKASDCSAPPQAQVASASDFRVQGLRRLDHTKVDDLKGALVRSNPVLVSFRVDNAWKKHRGAGVFDHTEVDQKWGGHAMAIVGYDDRKQAFRLINSWGKGWGDGGYAWVSYGAYASHVREAVTLVVSSAARPRPAPPRPPPPAPNVVVVKPTPPAPLPPAPSPVPRPVVVVKPTPTPTPSPTPVVVVTPTPSPAPVDPTPVPPIVTPQPQRLTLAQLDSLTCGKVSVRQEGKNNILNGYVGSESDLELVKAIAADVPDTSVGDVLLAPWPQCEALQTLEKPIAVSDRPAIELGPTNRFRDGDPLNIAIRSPEQISYLYVSYVQADGSVVHLVQPSGLVAQPTLPRQTLNFGGGQNGGATFTVGAPFGREMIIAIASRSPLFEHALPAQQSEREYLTELRRALVYKPSPDMPDRELSASIATLQTEGK